MGFGYYVGRPEKLLPPWSRLVGIGYTTHSRPTVWGEAGETRFLQVTSPPLSSYRANSKQISLPLAVERACVGRTSPQRQVRGGLTLSLALAGGVELDKKQDQGEFLKDCQRWRGGAREPWETIGECTKGRRGAAGAYCLVR